MKTERCAVWAGRREDEGFESPKLFCWSVWFCLGCLKKGLPDRFFFCFPSE